MNVDLRVSVPTVGRRVRRVVKNRNVTVHIIERFAPGGIETMVADIVEASDTPQFIISLSGTVESLSANWARAQALAGRLSALDRRPAADVRVAGQVASRLRALSATAVVAHHIGPLLYGGVGSRLAGVHQFVYLEHDSWHYQHSPSHRHILRFCNKLLQPKLAAVSDPVAQVLRQLSNRSVSVVPPGISMVAFNLSDRTAARQRFGLPETVKLVGAVGRLELIKGHADLLRALTWLPPNVEIVLAGDGSEKARLQSLARDHGIGQRVHFIGHSDNVAQLYPAFDVLALPSLGEGLPRAVLEAQACGVPVVASNVGGVSSALAPGGGKLVLPGDPTALAHALIEVLNAPPAPQALRAFVDQNFNLSRTIALLADLTEPI